MNALKIKRQCVSNKLPLLFPHEFNELKKIDVEESWDSRAVCWLYFSRKASRSGIIRIHLGKMPPRLKCTRQKCLHKLPPWIWRVYETCLFYKKRERAVTPRLRGWSLFFIFCLCVCVWNQNCHQHARAFRQNARNTSSSTVLSSTFTSTSKTGLRMFKQAELWGVVWGSLGGPTSVYLNSPIGVFC